jgi:hypothetical protein
MSSREIKVQSDAEILGAALEEAQRLIAAHQNPNPRRSRDDILAMLEFIICDPVVIRAMLRQKMRSRLKLVV